MEIDITRQSRREFIAGAAATAAGLAVPRLYAHSGQPAPAWATEFAKDSKSSLMGRIKPRHARDIASNPFIIGCECVDRDYTVYEHYRDYVGPLGAKTARIQSGWAKTEQAKGVYDFAWLDRMVDDLLAQGVSVWFQLSYMNPIYAGGGDIIRDVCLHADFPKSAEALAAWDNYVRAVVLHFRDRVSYWEIWNEPNSRGRSPMEYGDLFIRTARIIRELQPQSRIAGLSTAGIAIPYTKSFLEHLRAREALGLIDEVSFHLKPENPDAKYPRVERLQALVAEFSPTIAVIQGENGCPSVPKGQDFWMLADLDWSERSQAKWHLRDLLGHYARGITHAIFTIIDVHYPETVHPLRVLRKGLLASTPDMRVDHPKQSYFALQHAITIFDDTFERIEDVTCNFAALDIGGPMAANPAKETSPLCYAFKKKDTAESILAIWMGERRPEHEFPIISMQIRCEGIALEDPVLVDLLSGGVCEIPRDDWNMENGVFSCRRIPAYDSPVLIAERSLVRQYVRGVGGASIIRKRFSGGTSISPLKPV